MNKGFVRGLWGVKGGKGCRGFRDPEHRDKLDNDILLSKMNKCEVDFTSYTFGEDNHKFLIDNGIKSKLVDKRPIVWNLHKEHYRHKLEVLKCGSEDFDEVVLLDWDTVAVKPIDANFWDTLSKKYPIQAVLRRYRKNIRAYWREANQEHIPCASFIYVRDKNIAYDIIKCWETLEHKWSEEVPLAKVIDDLIGGWKGPEKYWECFEPEAFRLLRSTARVYSRERIQNKQVYFEHYWSDTVKSIIDNPEAHKNNPEFSWLK